MWSVLIYFRNVSEPIKITFDKSSDREVLLSLADKAMRSKDVMTLSGPNGFHAIIDATDVRAVLKG